MLFLLFTFVATSLPAQSLIAAKLEIFQDAVLQNTLSLSMQAGTAAHQAVAAKLGKAEFTASEAQTALTQIFTEEVGAQAAQQTKAAIKQIEVEVVAEHLLKGGTLTQSARQTVNARVADLQGAGSQLKARLQTARQEIIANYGKDNRLVTREQYAAADRRIQNRLRTAEGIEYRNSGVPLNNLPDISLKAAFHLEATGRSFKEFVTAMKPELAKVGRQATLSEYEELYRAKAAEVGQPISEIEIARAKLTTRSEAQLKADLDPTVKVGETIKQVVARVDDAKTEMTARGLLSFYHGLGETPPKLNIAENDAVYGASFNAHTLERHGADVPLYRSGVPAGTRTVEGRLSGDAPWNGARNFSFKWTDDSIMNQAINEYVQKNWNQIREDLTLGRQHKSLFDAGRVVGEGFYNKGIGGGVRQAVYHKTSLVNILIKVDQTEPPKPVVVTAYPAVRD